MFNFFHFHSKNKSTFENPTAEFAQLRREDRQVLQPLVRPSAIASKVEWNHVRAL